MYHWFRIVYKSYRCTGSVCAFTSRSVPANVAPLRLQFFSLAFFSVATLRLIPVIWLPSMSTPFRLAPATKTHSHEHDENWKPEVWKRVVKFFTLKIGFDSSRILKITAPQWSSFGVGAQHLHTLQVSCLWWIEQLCLYDQKHVNLTMCHWDFKSEILNIHLEN